MSIQDDIEKLEALRIDAKLRGIWGPKIEVITELDLQHAAYHAIAYKIGSEDLRQHLRYVTDADLVLRYEEVCLLRDIKAELVYMRKGEIVPDEVSH